jgi:FkbM family methyltransferase
MAIGRRALRYLWYPAVSLFQDRTWRNGHVQPRRIGSMYGGGWVALDLLDATSIVYSFGIGCDISFDRALIETTGCAVVGFDPTPRSAEWMAVQSDLPPKFTFHQFGLAEISGKRTLFLPENPDYVSGSITKDLHGGGVQCDFLAFADILKNLNHHSIDLIKLDIEGTEYPVLESWLKSGAVPPCAQLWVEFHPRLAETSTRETAVFVRSLETIGLVPAKRAFLQDPNHYLLVNKNHPKIARVLQSKEV